MLTENQPDNQIFRNCFVIIYCHLKKVSSQINKCIIFEPNELSIVYNTIYSMMYFSNFVRKRSLNSFDGCLFWWKAVQGSSRSAIHLPSVSQSHYLCLQVTGGEAVPAGSRLLWWHWHIGNVSSFFEEDSCGSGPSSCCGISAAPLFG